MTGRTNNIVYKGISIYYILNKHVYRVAFNNCSWYHLNAAGFNSAFPV